MARVRKDADVISDWVRAQTMKVAQYAAQTFGYSDAFMEKMKIEISLIPKVKRSHAGRKYDANLGSVPYVQLNFGGWMAFADPETGVLPKPFMEYSHVASDPEIGTLPAGTHWSKAAMALICHEVAHAVEYWTEASRIQISNEFSYYSPIGVVRGHGARWQYIYRMLRNYFVNYSKVVPPKTESLQLKKRESGFYSVRIDSNKTVYYDSIKKEKFFGGIAVRKSGGYKRYVVFPARLDTPKPSVDTTRSVQASSIGEARKILFALASKR